MRPAPILLAWACVWTQLPTHAYGQAESPGAIVGPPWVVPGPACGGERAPVDEPGTDADDKRRASSKDPCAVADNNLARDETEILKPKPQEAAAARQAWDHKSRPLFLDSIQRRFELRPADLAVIERAGFVVPARLEVPAYAQGYHEIFQSQLPVYITADSIFHAIFASHDAVVARLELDSLAPKLVRALDDMHCALVGAAGEYPPEVARDLDLYLLVARWLIADGNPPRSAFADAGVEREADELVAKATAASELATVELFGRQRLIDFTQYGPRGHYASGEAMQRYFRAAMWASRLEFNLVSRSSRGLAAASAPDPRETPREAIVALALANLATRSGADKAIADLDAAWSALAGRREDVSIAQLAELHATVGSLKDPDTFDKMKAAIGDRFRRTTRLHPMPAGSSELPAIATLIGPRIVADAGALMPLVNSAVPDRQSLGVADVATCLGWIVRRPISPRTSRGFPPSTVNSRRRERRWRGRGRQRISTARGWPRFARSPNRPPAPRRLTSRARRAKICA